MFMKIKEFIKEFKDAYNTINVVKINAKKAIDNFKRKVDSIVYTADSLQIIVERLEANYICFPIKERQDFIQKTLDLLRYGRKDDKGDLKDFYGLRRAYHSYAYCAKNNLEHLKHLYKKGRYGEVEVLAKAYYEKFIYCNRTYEYLGWTLSKDNEITIEYSYYNYNDQREHDEVTLTINELNGNIDYPEIV